MGSFVCLLNKGEEITRYFMREGAFIVDYNSYETQISSSEYIQAVIDVTIITFSRESMLEFKFLQLVNRIPLSLLASYLGITPSSLSRIRRNI